jgi:hypothetical protein
MLQKGCGQREYTSYCIFTMQHGRSGCADLWVTRLQLSNPSDAVTARKTDATVHVVANIRATNAPCNPFSTHLELAITPTWKF